MNIIKRWLVTILRNGEEEEIIIPAVSKSEVRRYAIQKHGGMAINIELINDDPMEEAS